MNVPGSTEKLWNAQRLNISLKIPGMTESYLHLWESRLREAVTILERVTIQKLQAAVNDERCIIQAAKGQFWAVPGQLEE